MGPLLHSTSMFAAMAVSALVSAAWEGAVLAGCVYLCLRLFPRLSAAARSVVWLNVFVLLVLLHVAPAMGGRSTGGNAASPAPFEVGLGWSFAIAGVWAALSLLRAVDLMWSAIRSSRLARRAHVVDAGDALRWLLEVRTAGGRVIRTAELCISAEVERPSVFGFFHPRILLPGALRERLTAEELEQVVVHEMEHLRRGDDWTNLLQKAALRGVSSEPGSAVGGAAPLRGAGTGLRRQRVALEPRAEGLCHLPHAAGGVRHGAAQHVPGAGRVGTAIGAGAPGASDSAAAGRVHERKALDGSDRRPDDGCCRRRRGAGAQPAVGQLCSAPAGDGSGSALAGC